MRRFPPTGRSCFPSSILRAPRSPTPAPPPRPRTSGGQRRCGHPRPRASPPRIPPAPPRIHPAPPAHPAHPPCEPPALPAARPNPHRVPPPSSAPPGAAGSRPPRLGAGLGRGGPGAQCHGHPPPNAGICQAGLAGRDTPPPAAQAPSSAPRPISSIYVPAFLGERPAPQNHVADCEPFVLKYGTATEPALPPALRYRGQMLQTSLVCACLPN